MWLRISRLGPESRTNLAFFNGFSKEFKADCARSPHKCRRFRRRLRRLACLLRDVVICGAHPPVWRKRLPRGLLPSLALAGRNLGLLWRNGGLLAGPSAASAPAAGHATKSSTFACVRPPFYRPDKIKKPGLPEVAGAVKTLGQRRSPRDGFRSRN